jgi:hypothetical protein
LADFFIKYVKVRQPIGRQDSVQTHDPNKQEVGFIFACSAAQNFEVFSNIQELNFKKQKPIAVDVLFKAYPMVPLLCRSNLAGQYL